MSHHLVIDPIDVLFYCNASKRVGFGHLRRCLFLAEELQPKGIDIAFAGEFDPDAMKLIREEMPSASVEHDVGTVATRVAVIDYMFDPQDMEVYDRPLIARVADSAEESILLTSAATVPADLPVDVVIGHVLEARQETSFELKVGFEYAPVAPGLGEYRPKDPEIPEQVRRIFIGFGNWDDSRGVTNVLRGLHEYGYQNRIDVLVPAALLSYVEQFREAAPAQDVYFHHKVPSVPALLVHADVAFGTYGNMTYEMLALGVPSIVYAVKDFMVEYTRELEARDLLVFGGDATEFTPADVKRTMDKMTQSRRHTLSRRSREAVDACGLRRVGEEIKWRIAQRSG